MRTLWCTAGAIGLLTSGMAFGSVLFNNGPMVTHPGAGPGGVDVSMASAVPNAGGSNANLTVWRADDFTVGGPGWIVSSVEMFAYDTGNAVPRWTSVNMQIRQGSPSGTTVGTGTVTWGLAGVNRTFNGVTANTDRQVHRLTGDFGNLVLAPGEYWVTLSLAMPAGVNGWLPYVMDINPANPNDPFTRVGNGMVSTDAGVTWQPGVVTTGNWNQVAEFPFIVNGQVIPEPTSALAALGLGGLMLRRRKA